jgi:hypothetical protein
MLWSTNQSATVSSVTQTTTKTTTPAATPAKPTKGKPRQKARSSASKGSVVNTTSTTTTLNGRSDQAASAQAPQTVSRRSETLTISLVSLGAALIFAAAVLMRLRAASLPGGASFTLDPATTADLATKVHTQAAEARLTPEQTTQAVQKAIVDLASTLGQYRRPVRPKLPLTLRRRRAGVEYVPAGAVPVSELTDRVAETAVAQVAEQSPRGPRDRT